MENRISRLESKIAQMEEEIAELRQAVGLAPKKGSQSPLSDEQERFLDACKAAGAQTSRVKIGTLRKDLDWDGKAFDDTLDELAKGGRLVLHQGGGGLSLSRMDDTFMGDNGESYTEVSLP